MIDPGLPRLACRSGFCPPHRGSGQVTFVIPCHVDVFIRWPFATSRPCARSRCLHFVFRCRSWGDGCEASAHESIHVSCARQGWVSGTEVARSISSRERWSMLAPRESYIKLKKKRESQVRVMVRTSTFAMYDTVGTGIDSISLVWITVWPLNIGLERIKLYQVAFLVHICSSAFHCSVYGQIKQYFVRKTRLSGSNMSFIMRT